MRYFSPQRGLSSIVSPLANTQFLSHLQSILRPKQAEGLYYLYDGAKPWELHDSGFIELKDENR